MRVDSLRLRYYQHASDRAPSLGSSRLQHVVSTEKARLLSKLGQIVPDGLFLADFSHFRTLSDASCDVLGSLNRSTMLIS